MSVAPLSHNIYPLPAATLRKNMKEPYVWGSGKRKGENGKRSFVSMSSERQTEYGRSSYRLVREQRMLAKVKTENGKRKRLSNNLSTRLLVYLSTNQSTRQLTKQLVYLSTRLLVN